MNNLFLPCIEGQQSEQEDIGVSVSHKKYCKHITPNNIHISMLEPIIYCIIIIFVLYASIIPMLETILTVSSVTNGYIKEIS